MKGKGLAQYDRMVEDVARAIVESHHKKFGKGWRNNEKYMETGRRYARVAIRVLRAASKKAGGGK